MRTIGASVPRTTVAFSICVGVLRTRCMESLAGAIQMLWVATMGRGARSSWLFLVLLVLPSHGNDQSDSRMGLSRTIPTTTPHLEVLLISWPALSLWLPSWSRWTDLIYHFRPRTQKLRSRGWKVLFHGCRVADSHRVIETWICWWFANDLIVCKGPCIQEHAA